MRNSLLKMSDDTIGYHIYTKTTKDDNFKLQLKECWKAWKLWLNAKKVGKCVKLKRLFARWKHYLNILKKEQLLGVTLTVSERKTLMRTRRRQWSQRHKEIEILPPEKVDKYISYLQLTDDENSDSKIKRLLPSISLLSDEEIHEIKKSRKKRIEKFRRRKAEIENLKLRKPVELPKLFVYNTGNIFILF